MEQIYKDASLENVFVALDYYYNCKKFKVELRGIVKSRVEPEVYKILEILWARDDEKKKKIEKLENLHYLHLGSVNLSFCPRRKVKFVRKGRPINQNIEEGVLCPPNKILVDDEIKMSKWQVITGLNTWLDFDEIRIVKYPRPDGYEPSPTTYKIGGILKEDLVQ